MSELFLLPEAKKDVSQAFYWYEEQISGLGYEFLNSLEQSFSKIRKNPYIFKAIFPPYRRALLDRFPYAVFYKPLSKKVLIYAVFHCAQHPKKWFKRM